MTHTHARHLIAACCFLAPIASANEAPPTPLDTIVVTASADPQSREQTAADVLVIDREQIEAAQAVDVAQLLRRYAGLDIGRTGGPGQQTSLFIRGGNSNHTLLLVDGVVVNSGSTGAAALQHLDPDLIERIEVLKGPRSSLYGSSAIAGVVQVFTRKGPRSGVDVGARLGSHQSRDLRAHAAWHGDDASRVSLAASSQRVDAFKPLADNPRERDYSQNSLSLDARRAFGNGDVVLSIWNSQAQVCLLYTSPSPRD